jgi:mannose-6-phosphate isomerase-like protein (cupin superfamily)
MNFKKVVHENEGIIEPDICGKSIELINMETSGSKKMSIATILINPSEESKKHFHKKMEEIYYIVEGEGEIMIDDMISKIKKGHAILLPVGSLHQIKNTGKSILKFISADSPPYDEKDVYII